MPEDHAEDARLSRPSNRSLTLVARFAAVLLLILGLALLASRPWAESSAEALPNPARMKIEYRPGGYFPPGFPLHGKVRLLSNPVVEMGTRTRVRIEYTVGDMPVETGMTVEIWKHFLSDAEELQVTDPNAPAYFSVEFTRPSVVGKTLKWTNWEQRNTPSVFPYRKVAGVTLEAGSLSAGDRVLFDLGGPLGFRMQHYQENLFNFRVVLLRDEKVLGYGGDAAMKVTGGPLRRLRVQAPSVAKAGEAFPVEIVPQDEWGSLARNHEGLSFRVISGEIAGGSFRYEPELEHYVARDVVAGKEGVLRIGVQTADGQYRGASNPLWVEADPLRRVYFGDLHQHAYLHDGRGVFEELYLYGRRVGLLDFGAVSPHHMPMSVTGPSFYLEGKRFPSENWPDLQKATKLMNGWQGFVSILGYEYSVGTNIGGHHNIYYNADEAKSTMQLDSAEPSAPIGKMLRTLQLVRKPVLVIPHIGGGPPDWSHPTDPRIERLFEIASVHGVFEESFQKHLESGQRLAASASGDTHTSAMGNAYAGLNFVMSNGLTGVYAQGKTRDDIWRAMYERRTFAVSNNTRILLDFRVNDEPMGGEILSALTGTARLSARVSGAAPLLRIELLKNSKVIYAAHPARKQGRLLRVVWGDNLYQRRAAAGLSSGELRPEGGRLRLERIIHRDQAFEEIRQEGARITWKTAAFSNDRDGFLVDLSEVTGEALHFRLDDASEMGVFEVRIPLAQLERDGCFFWSRRGDARVKHSYMEKMGVPPTFFLECELVDAAGPMDFQLSYEDRGPLRPGDYYYLRAEQLDTNKAWSSPVWVN